MSPNRFAAMAIACLMAVLPRICVSENSDRSVETLSPVLKSISPESAIAGARAIEITAKGLNFIAASKIEWNGSALITKFVSANEVTAQIPAGDLSTRGLFNVTVVNSSLSGGRSNTLVFTIDAPVPVLESISPSGITAGNAGITLTAMGSKFAQGSRLEWNGKALETSFVNLSELTAYVPGSLLSNPETAAIAVENPAPGGGPSAKATFRVFPNQTRFLKLPINANDIAWDEVHQRIYASLPSNDGKTGNSIVAIDPVLGVAGTPVAVGSEPNLLSISSDASYLWVGVDGANSIKRLKLPSLAKDIEIAIPPGQFSAPLVAISLDAAPGEPHTVAAAFGGNDDVDAPAVVVYDDGKPRTTSREVGYLTWLQWGANASALYGQDGGDTAYGFTAMSVNSSGVSIEKTYYGLFEDSYNTHFDKGTGYVYGDDGLVVDPRNGEVVGQFNLSDFEPDDASVILCVPDSTQGRVYFVGDSMVGAGMLIEAFDQSTYKSLGSVLLPEVWGTPVNLIRWGRSGLAFNVSPPFGSSPSSGAIYIVDGGLVDLEAPDDEKGTLVKQLEVLHSISPQSAPNGSADIPVTIKGSNFSPTSVASMIRIGPVASPTTPVALPTTFVSSTELIARIPAAYMTSPGMLSISVVDSASSQEAENKLGFAVVPAGHGITAINLSSASMVWDKSNSLLYAAVLSSDAECPDSIATINPMSGALMQCQYIGSDPYPIRISGDDAWLYTGFLSMNSVARVALPGLGSKLSWPLGAEDGPYTALDLQVAPDEPKTIAITLGNRGISFEADGGITIYDSNVPRPTKMSNFIGTELSLSSFDSLQWGASSSVLYAANLESGTDLYSLDVDSKGLTLGHDFDKAFNLQGADIHFDPGTGYIYADNGQVINPSNGTQVGTYGSSGIVVPDSSLNRVFIVGRDSQGQYAITSYDQSRFTPISSIALPGLIYGPVAFVRWGTSGLAIEFEGNPGMLYLINDPSFVNGASPKEEQLR